MIFVPTTAQLETLAAHGDQTNHVLHSDGWVEVTKSNTSDALGPLHYLVAPTGRKTYPH